MTSETQVQPQTLPIGYVIEDYRIIAVLGQGGFGITYKAADETLRRNVALKEYLPRQFAFRDGTGQVHPRSEADRELFEWGLTRFVDEGRALAMFRHPNIASVIRYIEQNGTAYLIMELEEGMDFEHWLRGRDQPDERRLVNGILVPVLEGLARVHDKGLLHRDIKPDNIFIRRDESPVLIDFGASRPHGPEASSKLTSIISAGYSPFEQYGSGERQGPWSDLYALGGTIYRAISGRPPVDAIARHQGSPLEPAVKVGAGRYSRRFLEAIDRTLSLDIAGRPQSARELLTLLGREPPPPPVDPDATMVNLAPRAARPPRRRFAAVVSGALVIAAAAGGSWYLLRSDPVVAPDPAVTDADRKPPATTEPEAGPQRAEPDRSLAAEPDRSLPAEPDSGPVADGNAKPDGTVPEAPAGDPQDRAAEPAAQTPAPAVAAEPLSEDRILAGLDVSARARSYRTNQLAGAMLEYTSIRSRFDQCQQSGCKELPTLLSQLREALKPQQWKPDSLPGLEMTVTIQNPKRLPDNEECPFMLDVVEQIEIDGTAREQVRTYCTSNGHDRVVQDADDVT